MPLMHSAHLKVVDDVSEAEVVYTDVVHVWDVWGGPWGLFVSWESGNFKISQSHVLISMLCYSASHLYSLASYLSSGR
jgi:hypothetical protein